MRVLARLLLALGAILGCLFVAAAPASAHPLGNFTVNRYTGILVQPDGVQVDHVVDLAEIPTAQLGSAIDDLPALAADQCASTGPELDIRVGGAPVRLALDSSSASTADGEGGLPITRITCGFSGTADIGADEVTVEDNSAPGSVGWREITAVGDEMTLTSSDVPATSTSDRLSSYPQDLLQSPLAVTSATLVVSPGGPAGVLPGSDNAGPTGTQQGWLSTRATDLVADSGWVAGLLALLAALALGAAHALSPGHGKTVMAFYLSQRGDSSLRSAFAVGSAVTIAHTGSVLLLGLLVSLSSAFVPARIYPWLTLATGALIFGLGLYLLARLRTGGGHTHSHGGYTHSHEPGHTHEHEPAHSHGDGHSHGHGRPRPRRTTTATTTTTPHGHDHAARPRPRRTATITRTATTTRTKRCPRRSARARSRRPPPRPRRPPRSPRPPPGAGACG